MDDKKVTYSSTPSLFGKSSSPLITITMQLYNKEKYLETWAESLSKQSYIDKAKIIIVEDGSTDGGREKIQKVVDKYNLPAKIFYNEKNMGLLYSTLKSYRLIDTKYWCVLDADDYYISTDKVKKAVEFLEKHKDHSAYACNQILKFANGDTSICFDCNIPSQTFATMKNALFFQTASITFRNFLTEDLLDSIDEVPEEYRGTMCADAFRWALAFQYGKIFFENSPDSVWFRDIGDWGTLPEIEQNLSNLTAYRTFFQYFNSRFGVNENTLTCLNLNLHFYQKVWENLTDMAKKLQLHNFKFKKSSAKDTEDLDKIFDELKNQCKCLSNIIKGA